jgi:hypothetical protein
MRDEDAGVKPAGRKRNEMLSALREIVLVAIGVWLAFSVDSWAQERAERTREVEYLTGLQGEFAQDVSRLRTAIEVYSEGMEGFSWVLHRAQDFTPIPPDSLTNALAKGSRAGYFTASDAVLADILASGNVGIIQSDSLRLLFGSWNSAVANHALMEQQEIAFFAGPWAEFRISDVPLHALQPEVGGASIVGNPVNLDAVVRSGNVAGILELRMGYAALVRSGLERMLNVAESIVGEAGQELETSSGR